MKAPCHQKPKFDGRRFLDLKLAQEIVAKQLIEAPGVRSTADLSPFSSIAPEAIRYLAQFQYSWIDFSLSHMSKALAQEIAVWPAEVMSFNAGMETTSEALVCFRLCPATLHFGDIDEALDQDAAKALSTCGGTLELALDNLEPEIAALLANHHDPLTISVNRPVALASIQALTQHMGDECKLHLKQPVTPELMAALHASTKKRVIDLTFIAHDPRYQISLLLCDQLRYMEILSDLDFRESVSMRSNQPSPHATQSVAMVVDTALSKAQRPPTCPC